jgi:hypothetical protein
MLNSLLITAVIILSFSKSHFKKLGKDKVLEICTHVILFKIKEKAMHPELLGTNRVKVKRYFVLIVSMLLHQIKTQNYLLALYYIIKYNRVFVWVGIL